MEGLLQTRETPERLGGPRQADSPPYVRAALEIRFLNEIADKLPKFDFPRSFADPHFVINLNAREVGLDVPTHFPPVRFHAHLQHFLLMHG